MPALLLKMGTEMLAKCWLATDTQTSQLFRSFLWLYFFFTFIVMLASSLWLWNPPILVRLSKMAKTGFQINQQRMINQSALTCTALNRICKLFKPLSQKEKPTEQPPKRVWSDSGGENLKKDRQIKSQCRYKSYLNTSTHVILHIE